MRIDPKYLMIIAEISDAGGFTKAASSLGTSQPAISRVVKMLEQRLGEPLTRDLRSFQALSTRRTRVMPEQRAASLATPRVEHGTCIHIRLIDRPRIDGRSIAHRRGARGLASRP
jgi:hypothetical protein